MAEKSYNFPDLPLRGQEFVIDIVPCEIKNQLKEINEQLRHGWKVKDNANFGGAGNEYGRSMMGTMVLVFEGK